METESVVNIRSSSKAFRYLRETQETSACTTLNDSVAEVKLSKGFVRTKDDTGNITPLSGATGD